MAKITVSRDDKRTDYNYDIQIEDSCGSYYNLECLTRDEISKIRDMINNVVHHINVSETMEINDE